MAQGNNSLTTYYAKRVIGDSAASSADEALLQTGANIVTDAWLLYRNNRTPIYGIKYKYDSSSNADKLELYGGYQVSSTDTPTAWVQMNTGDTYILGKVGINYDPNTSGNNYYLVVNGTSLFADEVSIKNEIYLLDDNSVVVGKFYVEQAGTTLTHGIARLDLGNNIDADEEGNSYGEIRLLGGSSDSVVSIQNRGSSILNVRAGIFNFYGSQYLTSSQFQQTLLVLGETLVDDVRTNTYPILEIVSSHSFTSGTEGYLTLCLGNSSSSTGTYYASNLTGRIQLYNSTGGYKYIYGTSDGIGTNGTITCSSGKVWIQGGSAAGGDSNRLTTSEGMPGNMQCNQGRRGTQIYANGIAFADPYNGNSNSDAGWIRHIETTSNSGTLEIAVGDDGDESIIACQYNTSNAVKYKVYLCSSSGMAQFPTNKNSDSNYGGASMWIREYNYGGAQSDSWGNAPRLGWHWAGRVAAQIGLASNGWLYEAPVTATNFYRLVCENSGNWAIRLSSSTTSASVGTSWVGSRDVAMVNADYTDSTSSVAYTLARVKFPSVTYGIGSERSSQIFGLFGWNNSRTENGFDWAFYISSDRNWHFNTKLSTGHGYINGAATNGGINQIMTGDDCWIGDCNVAGLVGLKAASSSVAVCGLQFYSGDGTYCGRINGVRMSYLNIYCLSGTQIVTSNGASHHQILASAFVVGSSKYIKENIQDLTVEEAKKILQIRPVSFDYKKVFGGKKEQRGVIAEEVEEIIPSVVHTPDDYDIKKVENYKGAEKNETIPSIKSVDYPKFVPYLIKLAQIQQEEIDDLKLQLKQLQEK